jgi:hypothetical protein
VNTKLSMSEILRIVPSVHLGQDEKYKHAKRLADGHWPGHECWGEVR